MENTKQKVLSNLIWRFGERCGAQLVQFIVQIILARILMPEDYGIVALITVFINILQVFVDSGLGNALIQKKDADDIDFSTVFYTNVLFCVFLYVMVFFVAPFISRFYDKVQLCALIRVLGITILISGVKNVQQAYVSKKLMFKKFFFATLIGTIGAAFCGIYMALHGMGAWAIVGQQLFNLTIDTIVLWLTVRWRPKLVFSFQRLKKLFAFGWKLLVSSILETVYNDVRQLIIGKMYTSIDLAFYNKGKQFPNFIVNNVNSSINSVLLPAMSNEQDNKARIRSMTRNSIKTSVFFMAPMMIGLVFCANNIITVLLTEKWLPCIPYLIVFCITYMFYPIHTANLNAIKALGRSDLFLKLEIIKKIIGITLLLLTMRISVMAMAYSLLVTGLISQVINAWPNKKLLDYDYIQQIKDIIPTVLLALLMGVIVYLFNFLNLSSFITLIVQIIIGGVVYILGAKLLKIDTYNYIQDAIKGLLKRK